MMQKLRQQRLDKIEDFDVWTEEVEMHQLHPTKEPEPQQFPCTVVWVEEWGPGTFANLICHVSYTFVY